LLANIERLWDVYNEWKALTEQEGRAIRDADWTRVHERQQQKRSLQSEIIHLTGQIHADFRSKSDEANFDARLRGIVNELLLLETRNNATLQGSIDTVREQRRDLDATSNRLRQLHARYVPNRAAAWENFS
jgi:hypothetical protein